MEQQIADIQRNLRYALVAFEPFQQPLILLLRFPLTRREQKKIAASPALSQFLNKLSTSEDGNWCSRRFLPYFITFSVLIIEFHRFNSLSMTNMRTTILWKK